jgi:hypothetical protein
MSDMSQTPEKGKRHGCTPKPDNDHNNESVSKQKPKHDMKLWQERPHSYELSREGQRARTRKGQILALHVM